MEDIKNNLKRELNDMNDSPILESNKKLYNCSECSSVIEIISIDHDNIEFKCKNNHNMKMKIKDYLDKMKEYNKNILNNNIAIYIKRNIYFIVLNVIFIYVMNV